VKGDLCEKWVRRSQHCSASLIRLVPPAYGAVSFSQLPRVLLVEHRKPFHFVQDLFAGWVQQWMENLSK
jgi:hypothetical protein